MILWGQSAGANSASMYTYAYPDEPIIAGTISDSGAAEQLVSSDLIQRNFTALAGMVGCGRLNATSELSCMRNVSATTLENTLSYYLGNLTLPTLQFVPFPDNKTAFSNSTDRALKGLVAKTVWLSTKST
jgi:carboxylesterase type B